MTDSHLILPDEAEATRRFGEVFRTLTQRSVDTTTFRRLTQLGMPYAKAILSGEHQRFIGEIATSGEYESLFVDRDAALAYFGGFTGMADQMTSNQLQGYQRSVDSASLVFAHSALDAATSDLCWVTALLVPHDWEGYVGTRKVSLSELRTTAIEDVIRLRVVEHVTAFERESLLTRTDRLFALCKPETGYHPIRGYRFDRDRLIRLDDLRHGVVHHTVAPSAFGSIEADLEFMFQTGLYLWAMVNNRYGVKIDVRTFIGLPLEG